MSGGLELLIWQFIKFCLVGSLGLVIDFGCTFLLKEKININRYLANSAGFSVAVVSNYLLNKYWTFEDGDPEVFVQAQKFVIIALIGLAINNQIIYLLNNNRGLNFYVAKLVAIIVVVFWNFFANYFYTFSV